MGNTMIEQTEKVNSKVKVKRGRTMPVERAMKLMSDYAKNNFNMYKTLIENGYSHDTANKQAGPTMKRARDIVKERLEIREDVSTREVATQTKSLYETLGISREMIVERFKELIMQNTHPAVALRALEPLIKQEGVNWVEKQGDSAPTVNIIVDEMHQHNANTPQIDPVSETPLR